MHIARLRLIAILAWIFGLVPLAGAQAQRPAAARAVPTDLLCGPQASLAPPAKSIRIIGGAEPIKALFAPGDAVTINAGTSQGVQAGQHFYVRRVIEDRFTVRTTEKQPYSIHTAGWLTVLETRADMSIAKISEACDGILEGDYLEPLVLPQPAAAVAAGVPDFARPGRVILGDDRRQLGAGGGSMMVIDRGSDHGLRAGQRVTIFRQPASGSGPVMTVGDATVSSTQFESSLIRIDHSRGAVEVGDLVAIHR